MDRVADGTATSRDFEFLFHKWGNEFRTNLIATAVKFACGAPIPCDGFLHAQGPAVIGARILAAAPGQDVDEELRSILGTWGALMRSSADRVHEYCKPDAVRDWLQEEYV